MRGVWVAQLFYGPLSDCFGRKPLFLLSLSIYTIASVICIFSTTIQVFILGRCLQALGSGGAVLVFAIIRDLYEGKQAAKIIAYMSAVVAISPIIGPILGGIIQSLLSWQYNFVVLALIGGFLLLLSRFIAETNQKQKFSAAFSKEIGSHYRYLFTSKRYLSNALSAAFAFGALFAYVSGAPYLFLNLMGYSSATFGWIFAIAAFGYVVGAFVNGKLISRFGVNVMSKIGMLFLVGGGLTISLFCYVYPLNPFAIILPQIMCEFGISVVISTCIAKALQPIPQCAGTGMALLGFLRFLAASGSSAVVMICDCSSALPLAVTVLGCSLLSFFCRFIERDSGDYLTTTCIG
ncbi:MAG: multidrug effflux MFS transporter [Proteobacteria bacterium]|nr:multidrug effflux MFS transporter [Pseudomonadota bacterium]